MPTAVAILIPVLNRPGRVQPLIESIREADEPGIKTRPVFVCSDGDRAEIRAVETAGLEPLILHRPGKCEYARKINLGAAATDEPWVFLGADDLRFHPGWARAALIEHDRTGCLVVGTNDLGNPAVKAGRHATHSLVHRDYLAHGTIDEPGLLLHEGYDHNSVDVEFVETARVRGQFVFAADSHVEHLHRLWGKAPFDQTYRKGMRTATADKRLFQQRRKLWTRRAAIR